MLTAGYVAAGTDLAEGDANGAVPQLEAADGALSAFSITVAECPAATP